LFFLDYLIFFFIGAIFGSFIYSFINRQPSQAGFMDKSIVSPPSFCPQCKKTLKPIMLIPIFSYIFLKGKCWYCKSTIKSSYLFYEILIGIFSITFFVTFEVSWISILKYIVCLLIIMQILLDYRFLLLSTNISILIVLLGLGLAYLDIKISVIESFIGLCLGYISLWLINYIFKTIKSKDGIGSGDFIFLGALCSVLGYKFIGPIVLGASIISLMIYFVSEKEKQLLPFGAGMGLATLSLIFFL
tara:strand:+ start:1677 stop:2411 length:735 start_codon:yes stop_codon:yes gene_type:complete